MRSDAPAAGCVYAFNWIRGVIWRFGSDTLVDNYREELVPVVLYISLQDVCLEQFLYRKFRVNTFFY